MRFLQDSVRVILALWLVLAPVKAWAGSMALLGAGGGSAAVPYVGPGDTYVGTPYMGFSCTRAFTVAYAAGAGSLCEVQRTSDNAKCTMKAATNGYVDLATAYCNSNTQTIVQFCNATTCGVDQAFDQTGNTRHLLQATQANQPPIVFSSSPTGTLPVISCGNGSTTLLLVTSGTLTQNQPLTTFAVSIITSNAVQGGLIGDVNGGVLLLASNGTANTIRLAAAVAVTKGSVTDNSWHALGSLASGASSILSADGSNTTGLSAGSTGISGQAVRLCRSNAIQYAGSVAEVWIWASTGATTDFNNLSTNAHSASSGYNF